MQTHRICHCGKCKLKCNKHGKLAKCADCGKTKLLGTIVEKGIIRHVCTNCIDKLEKELNEKKASSIGEINEVDTLHQEN